MTNEMKAVTQNELEYQELMIHKGVSRLKRGTRLLVEKVHLKRNTLEIQDWREW